MKSLLLTDAGVKRKTGEGRPKHFGDGGLDAHTGQVPPAMIRSKDNASGMPMADAEACESIDASPTDLGFSSPMTEARAELMWGGRR